MLPRAGGDRREQTELLRSQRFGESDLWTRQQGDIARTESP